MVIGGRKEDGHKGAGFPEGKTIAKIWREQMRIELTGDGIRPPTVLKTASVTRLLTTPVGCWISFLLKVTKNRPKIKYPSRSFSVLFLWKYSSLFERLWFHTASCPCAFRLSKPFGVFG